MNRAFGMVMVMLMASVLACTLTRTDGDDTRISGIETPTAIPINDAARTATSSAGGTPTPSVTPVAAPPTRQPTLIPTPIQFNTPVPGGNVAPSSGNPPANPGGSSGDGQAPQVAAAGGDPAAGAPQSGGYYFPNSIVYSSSGSLRSVGRDGSGGGAIGSGSRAVRSLNGLFVAVVSGDVRVIRPDGASVSQGSGQTTLPTWSLDGATAFFGSGSSLMRYQNGNVSSVSSVNGNIIAVEYSPDGGTVMFASANQIKLLHSDGSVSTVWDSGGETITRGPVWATFDNKQGLYVEFSSGRRAFISGEGMSVIDDPAVHLQLQSPANSAARVYVRADNGGTLTLVAAWPGVSDIEFVAPSLADVSWSPDGSQLVYAAPDGNLVLLDTATGGSQVIASGARNPVWTPPRYLVRN